MREAAINSHNFLKIISYLTDVASAVPSLSHSDNTCLISLTCWYTNIHTETERCTHIQRQRQRGGERAWEREGDNIEKYSSISLLHSVCTVNKSLLYEKQHCKRERTLSTLDAEQVSLQYIQIVLELCYWIQTRVILTVATIWSSIFSGTLPLMISKILNYNIGGRLHYFKTNWSWFS